jgi:hypothetical protein
VLEHEREWDMAEALARALTSSLRGELEAVRSAAEAEGIKHRKLLAQEQDRANALARDLATLETELKKTRIIGVDAVQGPDVELEHKRELEQERDRADALARELTSVRAERDAARAIAQTAETRASKSRRCSWRSSRSETRPRRLLRSLLRRGRMPRTSPYALLPPMLKYCR